LRSIANEGAPQPELEDDLVEAILAHPRAVEPLPAAGVMLFRQLLDMTSDLVLLMDASAGSLIDASDSAAQRLGYTRAELLQLGPSGFSIAASERPWSERLYAAKGPMPLAMEDTYRCKDGQTFPVHMSASYVREGQQDFVIAVATDITERTRQQARIAHLTRVLQMQSSINAAVLRIRNGDELLREACRLATQVGGYDRCTLWVADSDGRHARPMFNCGEAVELVGSSTMELSHGTQPDHSFTSYALRTGELTVCNDLARSELPIAMRRRLMHLGYKSLVAMPLIVGGRRMGALLLASRDINLVSDEEIVLLQEMRSSLLFALESGQTAGAAEYLAYYDPLTGLAKRTLFCERLDFALRDTAAQHQAMTIAAFDIHGLAQINGSFGWRIGDLLLQRVAERLKGIGQAAEHSGYVGGGTFLLFDPGRCSSAENIAQLLQSSIFSDPFEIDGHTLRLSFLLGIARYPSDAQGADLLVQHAEAALNRARETGEQYLTYEFKMHSEIAARLRLEHKLRTALDAQQFVLHYQPQQNVATGRIETVEALLRWNDPDEGLILPACFMPMLESSGMIIAVGDWVLERAIADCRRWRAQGLGPVRIAVNVSALQLRRRSFVEEVLHAADGLNDAGYGLELEITESSLLQDIDSTTRKLQELRANGIRIALDDFGTGYSSLALLSRLPVDTLKIDRSFISGLPHDPGCVALTSSIIQLAMAFGLDTVAEGVETVKQFDKLRQLRCVQSQGYLHCRALPVAQIESLLAAGTPAKDIAP
jgi:diguanylate cyclase (GGDEF)-like protein/PAS domain S-box-containing protein